MFRSGYDTAITFRRRREDLMALDPTRYSLRLLAAIAALAALPLLAACNDSEEDDDDDDEGMGARPAAVMIVSE
jgi:hypothetical protein